MGPPVTKVWLKLLGVQQQDSHHGDTPPVFVTEGPAVRPAPLPQPGGMVTAILIWGSGLSGADATPSPAGSAPAPTQVRDTRSPGQYCGATLTRGKLARAPSVTHPK